MINRFSIITGILLLMASCQSKEKAKEENTEVEKVAKVSIAEIEAGIKAYIAAETASSDGYFNVNDERGNFRLKLVRVHTEYLSNLGPKKHFACVDLADEKGDVYDVDFFMEGEPGNMKVTETSLTKLNGNLSIPGSRSWIRPGAASRLRPPPQICLVSKKGRMNLIFTIIPNFPRSVVILPKCGFQLPKVIVSKL
jgi:hypothetical protein